LALLALTIQFALSFGHLHPNGGQRAAAAPSVAEWAVPLAAALPDSPVGPPQDKPGLAGDFCAICALMQAAGAAVPSAAPVLPVWDVAGRTPYATSLDVTFTASPHLLFQARGPPRA
jgi:hypothetical protein